MSMDFGVFLPLAKHNRRLWVYEIERDRIEPLASYQGRNTMIKKCHLNDEVSALVLHLDDEDPPKEDNGTGGLAPDTPEERENPPKT